MYAKKIQLVGISNQLNFSFNLVNSTTMPYNVKKIIFGGIGMKLKVLIVLGLALLLFAACGTEERVEGVYLVASLQIVEHVALDGARAGFVSGLRDEGFVEGENLQFVYYNAQGDMSNALLMSTSIVELEPDLILGIATPTSQSLANATDTIPIVITAVTSPYRAGLVDSDERPGRNVTGTTDMTPVARQFELIMRLLPDAQRVGILYNAGEINSVIQADIAEEAALALGLVPERMTAPVAADVMQAAESVAGRVDVIYVPTCNLMAAGIVSIVRAAEDAGIPVISGEEGMVENGALATEGINYYELGRQTAVMAAQILRGEASPETMPIQSQAEYSLTVNMTTANILGITIPDDILAIARIVE